MISKIKKLFGGINLTWRRLVIFAVISGVYTGIVALIKPLENTSLHDIASSFEWWVLFAMIIITNSKKPLEAAVKTFVFFLISQPLVYLVQVPFSEMSWGLFQYYPPWFIWTLLTFPMAFLGWFVKKDKWYSLLLLSAMIFLLAETSGAYMHSTAYDFPHHLLTVIFCIVQEFVLVLFILEKRSLKIAGCIIALAMTGISIYINVINQPYASYSTNIPEADYSHEYELTVENEQIAKANLYKYENEYAMEVSFFHKGTTEIILTDKETGEKLIYIAELGDYYNSSVKPAGQS